VDAPPAAAGSNPGRLGERTDDSGFDPSSAIRSDFDATVVLLLWCIRKSYFPLLWLGMSFAAISYAIARRDVLELENQALSLDTPSEFVGALLSPLSIVAIAFIVRIAVGFLALAAAYPLSRSTKPHDHQDVRAMTQHIRVWRDRLYLSRAYRSLRWTWIVRNAAVEQLGRRGARLAMCNPVLRWAGIALFILFVVVFFFALAASME
jgi:hypothetical protein